MATGQEQRGDIQGLRAIAVLAVVLYHVRFPGFAGGYVGVDIFFVISGFLITGSLVAELQRTGRIDLAAFYARRIRRLLPAAIVVLLATAIAVRFLLSPVEQRELGKAIFFAAIYAVNFHFAFETTDYLAGDVHGNPVLHMWSLAVEEQFYLAWPFLIILAAAAGRSGSSARSRIVALTVIVAAASFVASIWMLGVARPWAFFGSPFRAWEFAAGGMVYLVASGAAPAVTRGTVMRGIAACAGLAMMLAAICLYDNATPFPGWTALLPVAGAALLIASGSWGALRPMRWLSARPMQRIGDVSYSWYLWHWPVLVLPAALANPGLAQRCALGVLSLALAWLTYRTVENPVRYRPSLARAPWRAILFGVVVTVAGASGGLALHAGGKAAESQPGQREIAAVQSQRAVLYRDQCHADTLATAVPECVYGDARGERTIFLVGDSHAAQWFPALHRLAGENALRLVALTKSACPMAAVTPRLASHGRPYLECDRWRDEVVGRIEREGPALVVIGHSSRYVREPDSGISAEAWGGGMREILGKLSKIVPAVVVLRDTPWPGFDVPTCLSRAYWRGATADACRYERSVGVDQRAYALDQAALAGIPGARSVDLTDLVCPTETCGVVVSGLIAYSDSHHLSVDFSRALAPELWSRLRGLLDEIGSRSPATPGAGQGR